MSETALESSLFFSISRSRAEYQTLYVPLQDTYCFVVLSRTFCDTTMYLYVSEIFPMEIRPIGMGFSPLGQFAGKLWVTKRSNTAEFLTISKQLSFSCKPRR
jgi:hypothetical protein